MNYFKSFLLHYWYYFVIGALIIVLTITSFLSFHLYNKRDTKDEISLIKTTEIAIKEESVVEEKMCTIDIKGAVKKAGVYKTECNKNINDVINLAGGKNKNAYTDNINLSKKITDQMVIYVYTTKEIKNSKKDVIKEIPVCETKTIYIDSCTEENSSTIETNSDNSSDNITESNDIDIEETSKVDSNEQKLISLNSATKEELMTLTGIGESKALNIIDYRNQNNGFKNIEELKNVSGIGDSIFEKIKSNITI